MKNMKSNSQLQLFICGKKKEGKACCADKGAPEMVETLKTWLKENKLNKHFRVSQTTCLGHCENGITACFYPENLWFTEIQSSDLPILKEMIINRASNP